MDAAGAGKRLGDNGSAYASRDRKRAKLRNARTIVTKSFDPGKFTSTKASI